jgi:hypothetical protein
MQINYAEVLPEQLARTRFRDGRWERLEDGEWVPWPVLKMDRLGRLEALRCHGRTPRTEAA